MSKEKVTPFFSQHYPLRRFAGIRPVSYKLRAHCVTAHPDAFPDPITSLYVKKKQTLWWINLSENPLSGEEGASNSVVVYTR